MKISAKTDYACRAILELALHWPSKEPLQVQEIAKKQKIPIKFLTHILIALKQSGYADSLRGQKGGYILLKAPKDIRLIDIVNDFSETEIAPKTSKSSTKNILNEIWSETESVLHEYLKGITFEHILIRHNNEASAPMYTI